MSKEPPNKSPYFYSSSSPSQMQQQNQQQEPLQDDLLMAAQALGQLKQNSPPLQSPPQQSQSQSQTHTQTPDDQRRQSNPTIFDKVIAQSINYMLEKTISTSNNYVMEDVQHSNSANPSSAPNPNSDVASINSNGVSNSQYPKQSLQQQQQQQQQNPQLQQPQLPLPIPQTQSQTYPYNSSSAMVPPIYSEHLKRSSTTISHEDDESTLKRPRLTPQSSTSSLRSNTLPPLTSSARFPRFNPTLRQHVTVNSAVSAQRSLQDLKELSVMNLNIESRKRVNMLINFLKMGNSQLSENIESLINLVETERTNKMQQLSKEQNQEHESPNGSPVSNHSEHDNQNNNNDSNSDQLPIQQVKKEIVTTVKKIVNVVSKVSANSLPEPARSHVREMLLKLPSNWAMMFEQQLQLQQEKEKNKTDNVSDSDTDDEDDDFDNDHDNDNHSDVASVDTQYEDSVEEQKSTTVTASSSSSPSVPSNGGSSPTRRPQRKQHIAQRLLMNLFKYKPKQQVNNSPPRSFSSLSSLSTSPQSHSQSRSPNKLKSKSSASSIKSLTDSSPEERSWFRRTIKKQIQNNDPNGKILILCQESLDMINSIIRFCNDNLQKAEMWNLKEHEKLSFELVNKLQYMNNAYAGSEKGQVGDSGVGAGQRQVLPPVVGSSSSSLSGNGSASSSTTLPSLQNVTKNSTINNLI
ncbi:unnamed protein product [Ambrosiozyma monospora]|uniref:Unnamed protein product n=1 Tax=Ambrosiozyma monospora TaxID=43982 RepID=A0ACB5T395_AMBMO|nr:unnamed protein product [Ambrosiozyma monospora]